MLIIFWFQRWIIPFPPIHLHYVWLKRNSEKRSIEERKRRERLYFHRLEWEKVRGHRFFMGPTPFSNLLYAIKNGATNIHVSWIFYFDWSYLYIDSFDWLLLPCFWLIDFPPFDSSDWPLLPFLILLIGCFSLLILLIDSLSPYLFLWLIASPILIILFDCIYL